MTLYFAVEGGSFRGNTWSQRKERDMKAEIITHKVRAGEVIALFTIWISILVLVAWILAPSTALAIVPGDAWTGEMPWPGGPVFHDAADCSWWHFFQGHHWYDPAGTSGDLFWWLR